MATRNNTVAQAIELVTRASEIETRLRSKHGLDIDATAQHLGISSRTVRRVVEDLQRLGGVVSRNDHRAPIRYRLSTPRRRLVRIESPKAKASAE
jgi:predicted DNA-binding transcriptional regulator YafY